MQIPHSGRKSLLNTFPQRRSNEWGVPVPVPARTGGSQGIKTPPSPPLPPPSPPPSPVPPPPVPPPPPPEGPGEDPAAAASAAPQGGTTTAWPRAAIPGLDRAAWRAWGRAPGGRAEMSAPGTPAPPGRRLATKVARAEVVAARRGGRAWGTHVASGQPQGMAESAPPRAGKVPQSPPASPRNSSPASTAGKGELDVSLAGQAMVSKPQANDH